MWKWFWAGLVVGQVSLLLVIAFLRSASDRYYAQKLKDMNDGLPDMEEGCPICGKDAVNCKC